MKYKLSDRDLDCSHYRRTSKDGKSEGCICSKKFKGYMKNLRMHFKVTKEQK
jgi:hypothetical protein